MMKRFSLAMFAIALALVFTQVSLAQTYNFSFAGNGAGPFADVTGNGTFTVSGDTVTALTGTFYPTPGSPEAMTLDVGWDGADQLLLSAYPWVDFGGLSFDAGSQQYNIFSEGGIAAITQNDTSGPTIGTDATALTTFSVPEGSDLSMLALCGLGLVGAFFFKARQAGMFVNR